MAKNLQPFNLPVLPAARYSFFRAFGVQPDCQIAIENYYASYPIAGIRPGDAALGLLI
jgi:hypothetical protein